MTETSGAARLTLIAELWYAEVPDLEDPRVLEALRSVWRAPEARDGSITVPHPLDAPELPPLLTVVVPGSPLGQDGKALPDASQTWDWPEAEDVVRSCRSSVLVTELLTQGRTA